MKVKDLIKDLSEMDPEAEVKMQTIDGCHGPADTYDIDSTDYWEASEKYGTPATALIEVGNGCFCDGHRGSKIKFLNLNPQHIDQYYLGLDAAFEELSKDFEWYREELNKLGKGKDYEEHIRIKELSQGKRALEVALRKIGKMKHRGKKEETKKD